MSEGREKGGTRRFSVGWESSGVLSGNADDITDIGVAVLFVLGLGGLVKPLGDPAEFEETALPRLFVGVERVSSVCPCLCPNSSFLYEEVKEKVKNNRKIKWLHRHFSYVFARGILKRYKFR